MAKKKSELAWIGIGLVLGVLFGIFGPIIMAVLKLFKVVKMSWIPVLSSLVAGIFSMVLMRTLLKKQMEQFRKFSAVENAVRSANPSWLDDFMKYRPSSGPAM